MNEMFWFDAESVAADLPVSSSEWCEKEVYHRPRLQACDSVVWFGVSQLCNSSDEAVSGKGWYAVSCMVLNLPQAREAFLTAGERFAFCLLCLISQQLLAMTHANHCANNNQAVVSGSLTSRSLYMSQNLLFYTSPRAPWCLTSLDIIPCALTNLAGASRASCASIYEIQH